MEKDTRKPFAEEKEMIKVIWQPTWEAAELLLDNPDFKAYVDSYEMLILALGSRRGAPKSRKHPNATNFAHLHNTPTTATLSNTPQAPHYKQLNQRPTTSTHRSTYK